LIPCRLSQKSTQQQNDTVFFLAFCKQHQAIFAENLLSSMNFETGYFLFSIGARTQNNHFPQNVVSTHIPFTPHMEKYLKRRYWINPATFN